MKIDLGCGKNKIPGYTGVDSIDFPDVDIKEDALTYLKVLLDESIKFINMSHFLEHLDADYRVNLFNEIYRVLVPEGVVFVTCPSFECASAYGDPTHKWPPISFWTFFYLNREWRENNAPHTKYTCNFLPEIKTIKTEVIVIEAILKKIP